MDTSRSLHDIKVKVLVLLMETPKLIQIKLRSRVWTLRQKSSEPDMIVYTDNTLKPVYPQTSLCGVKLKLSVYLIWTQYSFIVLKMTEIYKVSN